MKYQRISAQKLNKIFLCFSEDVTATAAARIAGVNRNTVNSYYARIRKLVFEESQKETGCEFGKFDTKQKFSLLLGIVDARTAERRMTASCSTVAIPPPLCYT